MRTVLSKKKKSTQIITDSEDSVDSDVPTIKTTKKPAAKKAAAAPKKKKKVDSSEDDDFKGDDSDDDDFVSLAKKTTTARSGRGATKKTKYNFSSSDED